MIILQMNRRTLETTRTDAPVKNVDTREALKEVRDRIKEINKTLTELTENISKQQKIIDELNAKKAQNKIPALKQEKQEYHDKVKSLYNELNALRDSYNSYILYIIQSK